MGLPRQKEPEKPDKTNQGFIAMFVIKHLFGDSLKLKSSKKNTGLISGLKKVIRFVNCVNIRDIVTQNLNESRIIGSLIYQKREQIFISASISFMMAHIFTKMDV